MNLGILASGRGSNMLAVLNACRSGRLIANPKIVISNNENSQALSSASEFDVKTAFVNESTHPDFEQRDSAICKLLVGESVELVLLLGYLKRVGPQVLEAFSARIINIHPSLLPKFGDQGMYGINVHQAVIDSGESETGATIHQVTQEYDSGPILAQRKLAVLPGESAQQLADRVLALEHELLIETITGIVNGDIELLCS